VGRTASPQDRSPSGLKNRCTRFFNLDKKNARSDVGRTGSPQDRSPSGLKNR